MLVYRVLTWNLKPMILSLSAKQHSLPRSPPHLLEASLGFEYIPTIWLQKWNQKMLQQESVMSKNYEKIVNLWHPLAGDLPNFQWRAVNSLHLVVPSHDLELECWCSAWKWMNMVHAFPSWIGLSLSHPTRPCDVQRGHGWEHR